MAPFGMKHAILSTALALSMSGTNAFSPALTKPVSVARIDSSKVFMVDGPEDGKALASGRKEIKFDAKSGRFFETGKDAEDCVPDDEYCVVDKDSGNLVRLTVEEKERIFLDALQSYYVTGRQLLADDEFDLLKEDLQWNGSSLVQLNRKEATYLAAMQAYLKGEPIMMDSDFDKLKAELKEEGSKFAVSTEPKCYIDTGICTVTMKEDFFRGNLLYLPVGAIITIFWLGFGFEIIEPIVRLNPLFLIALGTPLIYNGAKTITDNFIFPNNKVVYGPCPACEAEQRIYFGDILGVEGFKDVSETKCSNCKTVFKVQRNTLRASTIPK
eukprot:CAMPEP_0184861976 /NCGR_PEP_ID=MMETSP0580-20130426/6531_1 /TAXON_ID=1118495 /ORGANISM="Dactyliosolen fragilissimus" /LENGTH=326 /DNA_ID=CAMNT_0027359659 /DNA_START=29 /DNA_END=1009 /DNA_ORIENTATION=-